MPASETGLWRAGRLMQSGAAARRLLQVWAPPDLAAKRAPGKPAAAGQDATRHGPASGRGALRLRDILTCASDTARTQRQLDVYRYRQLRAADAN